MLQSFFEMHFNVHIIIEQMTLCYAALCGSYEPLIGLPNTLMRATRQTVLTGISDS